MTNIAKAPLELNSSRFYLGLAIALVLHLLLISLPIAFWIDMNLFKAWSIDLIQQGFFNFYNFSNCDYPPAYLYILWLIGKIYQLLFDPTLSHTDGVILMAMIKLPPVLADIGSAFLIARILKPYTTHDVAHKIALIYAFNPLMLFVSSVWGQVDGVMVLLMLWAFYLIQQNLLIRAGLLIAVMVIVKPQGLFLAPFLVLSQWFRQTWWKWMAIAVGGLALIWSIVLPFYGLENGILTPFFGLYQRLQGTANYYDFASVNAFNIWGWANWQRDATTFLGISYKVIGLAFLGILTMWLGIFLYQQRHFAANCLAAATMLIGFFMLPTRMHERYMLYGLAFIAIAIAIIPTIKWIYWGFTITGSVNVGYVYLQYNYEALFNAIPEVWGQSVIYIVSAVNIILFGVLLSHTIRWQPIQALSINQP
jgi:Gpi18-like mannosyltransferase